MCFSYKHNKENNILIIRHKYTHFDKILSTHNLNLLHGHFGINVNDHIKPY